MKIWAHTLVKNDENYIWYSIMSVIEYVDRILVWDTGSTDKTIEIIKDIQKKYTEKIKFRNFGEVDINKFPIVRQKMLKDTDSDWIFILDGDEVWWDESVKEVLKIINDKTQSVESLVHRCFNIIGDMYHYQGEDAGNYKIDNIKGHLNIRIMSAKIPGLHASKPHGQQGYFDDHDNLIQERPGKRIHIEKPAYMHFTNMKRSSLDLEVPKRSMKYKYEIGNQFPLDFYYPEVFFIPRPRNVPRPWICMSRDYYTKALIQTPLKKVKRYLFRNGKTGY